MVTNEAGVGEGTTVGRGGLELPSPESAFQLNPSFIIFDYFKKLWELRQVETEVKFYAGSAASWPEAFNHELFVPASSDKPLTILKASFIPNDRTEVEHQARLNAARARGVHWTSVDAGNEDYGVYVLPDTLGPAVPLLTTTYRHQFGGSGKAVGRDEPSVFQLGGYLSRRHFEPDGIEELPGDEAFRVSEAAFSKAMRTLITETVDFLS